MNSEELELSLRTEFEQYLKGVVAEMRQDVADFQKNFEAEFDKHRSQMDDAFRSLTARFESDVKFDPAFTESVVEHLRLARDDGAQLTAEAFSEAQKLDQPSASPAASYNQLRDAINEISGQMTQSAILKSLVDQAARFTGRGAFFIVKQDNFICWRKFDHESYGDDDRVREIRFPVSADTMLADSVHSLQTSSSSHSEDSVYLDALGFGRPDQMVAVPLIARGRAVAVLYADGSADDVVNLEAIESLVRVAGLTVELRAASSSAAASPAPAVEAPASHSTEGVAQAEEAHVEPAAVESFEPASASEEVSYEEPAVETPAYEEYVGEVAVEDVQEVAEFEAEPVEEYAHVETEAQEEAPVEEVSATPEFETSYSDYSEPAPVEAVSDFAFASSDSYDASVENETAEPEPVEEYAYSGEAANGTNGHSYEAAPEPVVEVAAAEPMKSRLSNRHVDLPIEVSDDERRFHNDARRFARLLVSEIKLYNEQKVNEGRDASDLYDRLREAIDRSREMYDKRVQAGVASKFDYFHYELVNNLAEGNGAKLGASYPGATV